MDPSKLAERLRAIVRTPGPEGPGLPRDAGPPIVNADADDADDADDARRPLRTGRGNAETILGGGWRRRDGLSCFVVERRHTPEATYGRDGVCTIARRLAEAAGEAPLLMGGAPARPPFAFFDLETTGLSGGAGTYAFLVGCGVFDDDGGFLTRQFVLLRHADERQLLQMVGSELALAGALVTFNGKSFDAPLFETRYLFHRLEWTGGRLPHLDVLHPSRRFWSDVVPCSLEALESLVLGARRTGDVPGREIPTRYFEFIRTGDARPLRAVLEHNRLDLLSLAGLTARLLDLVRRGPGAARHAREALALGRVYARGGLDSRARGAYQHACTAASMAGPEASMAGTGAPTAGTGVPMTGTGLPMASTNATSITDATSIKVIGLRSLALLSRRSRRYDEAAAYWRELLDLPGCPLRVAREASQALAVHHEHRARDLPAARAFALRSVDAHAPAWNQAVQYRLARLERKMNGGGSERPRPIVLRRLFPS